MCLRIRVRELRSRWASATSTSPSDDAVSDVSQAGDLVDFFSLAPLHVERIAIGARVRRGVSRRT
jgi:hypothetical protein